MDHQIPTIVLAPSLDAFCTDQVKYTSSRVATSFNLLSVAKERKIKIWCSYSEKAHGPIIPDPRDFRFSCVFSAVHSVLRTFNNWLPKTYSTIIPLIANK